MGTSSRDTRTVLVRYADDLAALARRGCALAANARLLVVRCEACGASFLYDERADRLYVDPDDLARVVEDAADADRAAPCPACRRSEWTFADVPAEEVEPLLDGPWGFCFWRPPPPASPPGRLRRAATGLAVGALVLLGATALVLDPDPLASPDKARKRIHVAE